MAERLPPNHRCNNPTCRTLIREGSYCEVHDFKKHKRKRDDLDRQKDRERGTSHERGYGARWKIFRRIILAERGICEDCHVRPATDVHHIIKKSEGGPDTRENVMALCKEHHDIRTGRGE